MLCLQFLRECARILRYTEKGGQICRLLFANLDIVQHTGAAINHAGTVICF